MNSITSLRVYLHYHDYILDGRWVVTENIDSDDKSAVVRNKGDGWDDEECPEKETYQWELRSRRGGKSVLFCWRKLTLFCFLLKMLGG